MKETIINILAFLGALFVIGVAAIFVLYRKAQKHETYEITDGEYHFDKKA